MNLLQRLFSRPEPTDHGAVGDSRPGDPPAIRLNVETPHAPLVQVSGTTTFCREQAAALAEGLLIDDGYLECPVTIQRYPEGANQPEAIQVRHESRQIGALPTSATRLLNLDFHTPLRVPAQLFASDPSKGPRLDAWVWLGRGQPEWKYSRQHRPPFTTSDRAAEHHRETQALVQEAPASDDPHCRQQFSNGCVDGIHYLETVEPIKQLKRDGRLAEALALCYLAIQGAEQESASSGREPAPWYTIQAAIIHRKLNQHSEEIAVLRRWLDNCPEERRHSGDVGQRWEKLTGTLPTTIEGKP